MSTEAVTELGWVPTADSFGARLALIRQRLNWNIKEAALECELPPQSWRTWEGGGSCRDQERVARKIAARTGCDYLWLFAGYARPTMRTDMHLSYNTAKILMFPQVRASTRQRSNKVA